MKRNWGKIGLALLALVWFGLKFATTLDQLEQKDKVEKLCWVTGDTFRRPDAKVTLDDGKRYFRCDDKWYARD